MKGRQIRYSAEELAWLEANRLMVISDYAREFNATFGRDIAPKNLHALRKRKGWKTGRTGCFSMGQAPHNKGKPHPSRGRAAETQFKKGALSGQAAKNYKPVGTERLCEDGYLERKIRDDGPAQRRWRAVHLIRWESIHGPIPEGHCLKCLDGNRLNTNPENWECISRSLLPRLVVGKWGQGFDYDAAPAELKPAILTLAKLKHASKTRTGNGLKAELDASGNVQERK